MIITGKRKSEARKEFELHRDEYPINKDFIGFVIGKGGENIKELKAKCSVMLIDYDESKSALVLVGTEEAVVSARELLDVQVPYFDKLQTLREKDQSYFF